MIEGDLYRAEDIRIRQVRGFSNRCLMVTFDAFSDIHDLDRPGYGEAFFRDRQIDAVHVLERGNTWYQRPDTPAACAAIADLAGGYERVVAYGSSMGAYAAIRFGRLAGASEALALSPQYSVDPSVMPFELRWRTIARQVDFRYERPSAPFVETSFIVYDPRSEDRSHVRRFRGKTKVVEIEVMDTGHPVTGYLAETGLLQACLLDFAAGRFDAARLAREARSARDRAPQMAFNLSTRERDRDRRLGWARRACELAPDNALYRMNLGRALVLARQNTEGLEVCREALRMDPQSARLQMHLAETLSWIGRFDEAEDLVRDLTERIPDAPVYRAWLGRFPHMRRFHRLRELFDWRGRMRQS